VPEPSSSEEFFRQVVENGPDAIERIGRDYRRLYVNAAFAELIGLPPAAIVGRTNLDLGIPAALANAREERVRAVFDSGRTLEIEDSFPTPHGVRFFQSRYMAECGSGGRVSSVVAVHRDITGRRHSDQALFESIMQYKEVFDSISICVFVIDVTPEGRFKIAAFNPAEEALVGLTNAEVAGRFIEDLFPADLANQLIANYRGCVEAGRTIKFDHFLDLPRRGRRFFHSNLIPLRNDAGVINRIIGACVETTEFRRTQEEALAKQNLETLGVLAGGIAHDFNNVLGGIHAQAELIEAELPSDSPASGELDRIKVAAIRGSEIVRELMVYAGQDQSYVDEAIDVSRLIEEMLGLLRVSISKHSALRTHLSEHLPAVPGKAPQLRQVVMNLVINASEAIEQEDGVITLTTAHVAGGTGAPNSPADLPPRDYVLLEVSDTGGGIPDEARAKIFDPFFTTKFAGRGMGLAVVQRIVHDHGGVIRWVTSPGQGTTFQVFFPCAAKSAARAQHSLPARRLEEPDTRKGAILVVDDEELLRAAISKSLRRLGYLVLEAGDGFEAMERMQAHKEDLEAVLLDVSLPGVSSLEVFQQACKVRPDMKVVVTSAYSKETVDATFQGMRVHHFIRKPFRLGDLMRLLTDPVAS
jgi:two-component system, cell cycle sensor histidine kinase and response regulator CckA